MAEEEKVALRWGCGHVQPDPALHEAGWSARLIYDEVRAGGRGSLPDRQDRFGDPRTVDTVLVPVEERALAAVRWVMEHGVRWAGESERGRLVWREGRVLCVLSPQQSYGYLYMSCLLEREGHEAETRVWPVEEMEAGATKLPGDKPIAEYGNTPALAELERREITATIEWAKEHGSSALVREWQARLRTFDEVFRTAATTN